MDQLNTMILEFDDKGELISVKLHQGSKKFYENYRFYKSSHNIGLYKVGDVNDNLFILIDKKTFDTRFIYRLINYDLTTLIK